MKKLLLALLFPILSMAQEEKINFTHKLEYQMTSKYDTIALNLYFSPDGNIVEVDRKKILLKDQLFMPIYVNLDGAVNLTEKYNYNKVDSIPSFTLTKTNKKDKINGMSCNYYDVQISDENLKMCISENNAINILGTLPVKNSNIKGLIVKIGPEKRREEWFELKSINKTKSSISIDWQKALAKVKEELKEQDTFVVDSTAAVPYEYNVDPVAVDSLIVIPQSTYYDDEIYEREINNYKSNYKNQDISTIDLAIAHLEDNSPYWKGLPVYCKELDQKVSVFKNKSVKEHALNYAGQLCDLYLSEIKEYSVDVKGTLDQIRYEENYFRNTVFDKKDQKVLNEFLNDLD